MVLFDTKRLYIIIKTVINIIIKTLQIIKTIGGHKSVNR